MAELEPSVLVVEDDESTRFAYAQILTRAGFTVRATSCGQDALDLLHGGFRPTLVLVDLLLPDVGGCDILTTMHDDPILRFVPTIVVTGASESERHVNADAVLSKPVDAAHLVGVIRTACDKATHH